MMGVEGPGQDKLFYTKDVDLEKRVRKSHTLRKIARQIDFTFIYEEVSQTYGARGNVSVPPPVILKLMLLLVLYNVRSERELMDTVPERLDWLWFLGYDLETDIPDHSVLSKARRRWGPEVFRGFFERIVLQCIQAGLVDGKKIFVDSSIVDADASKNSVIDTRDLKDQLREQYKELEARLEERQEESNRERRYTTVNNRYISGTDPDAGIVRRGGKAKLCYQVHRAVDERHEVITATETTSGDVNEAHLLGTLLETHCNIAGQAASTVVADSKYGTVENYLLCHDKGVAAHMPDLGAVAKGRSLQRSIFPEDRFTYDPEQDVYVCPAGETLKLKSVHEQRESMDYTAKKKVCAACNLRDSCTKNKSGRTIKRHFRQEDLDRMREASRTAKARKDIKTRQHLMERSFARSTRYGFDRARWRGLWRVRIQEFLVCALQNILVLINAGRGNKKAVGMVRKGTGESSLITRHHTIALPQFSSPGRPCSCTLAVH